MCMLLWGTLTMLLAACKSASSLYATRFFLGIFEAVRTGVVLLIMSVFPRIFVDHGVTVFNLVIAHAIIH